MRTEKKSEMGSKTQFKIKAQILAVMCISLRTRILAYRKTQYYSFTIPSRPVIASYSAITTPSTQLP